MTQSKDTCFSLEGKLGISNSYYRMGDYDTSEKMAKELLDELKGRDLRCTTTLLSNTLGRLFWISKNQNRFEEALQYLLDQEKLLSEIPPTDTFR